MEYEYKDLDPPIYNEINGIKIFTGTTKYNRPMFNRNIEKYKRKLENIKKPKFLSPLIPSTLTVKGKFSNIVFKEEELIKKLDIIDNDYIVKIVCNFGKILNENSPYFPKTKPPNKSNRGRKKKKKPKSKRKPQGSGDCFNSQITFEIYSEIEKGVGKIYKIKLFRPGVFQVPGVRKVDMSDLIKPITILRDYLRNKLNDNSINTLYFISLMRNYRCALNYDKLFIHINSMQDIFIDYKNEKKPEIINHYIDNNFPQTSEYIKKYIDYSNNHKRVAGIHYNPEKCTGLIIKIYKIVVLGKDKDKNKTTIKILKSGKINFKGGNSEEEIFDIYNWFQLFILKNHKKIIYNQDIDNYDYSLDTSGYESIYDSDSNSDSDNKITKNISLCLNESDLSESELSKSELDYSD